MKRKILLSICVFFLISILSGCGDFNLNIFTIPNDINFMNMVESLQNPEEISQYMVNNFEYEAHARTASPYELFLSKKGDCDEFADFSCFIANYHGYETWQIKIFYDDIIYYHVIAVFKENNKYNFSDNQYYFSVNYGNFSDIVKLDSQWIYDSYGYIWTKYIVYDYDMNIIETGYNN